MDSELLNLAAKSHREQHAESLTGLKIMLTSVLLPAASHHRLLPISNNKQQGLTPCV